MRWCFRLFAGLVVLFSVGAAFAAEARPSREETLALQKRLTDAGCYHGAIDGALSAALDTAVKACPDQTPVPRIEAGMHTAVIKRIGVDVACARIATASDDKTVRLWSLPDGKLQRTIRLPIGPGNGGKVYAAALSPDGRHLAAGGWDASWAKLGSLSLSLVDLDSGAIRRVGTFPDVIDSLAFSADGARVAVGLGNANGVRVYDWASGKELFTDRDYAADVYGLAFAPDDALIASSWDGQLRRYGPDLRRAAKRGGLAGQRPFGVAVDPAGRRLAVGFGEAAKVSILDAVTLAPIGDADLRDVTNGGLATHGRATAGRSRREAKRSHNRTALRAFFCARSIQTDGGAVPTSRFRRTLSSTCARAATASPSPRPSPRSGWPARAARSRPFRVRAPATCATSCRRRSRLPATARACDLVWATGRKSRCCSTSRRARSPTRPARRPASRRRASRACR